MSANVSRNGGNSSNVPLRETVVKCLAKCVQYDQPQKPRTRHDSINKFKAERNIRRNS